MQDMPNVLGKPATVVDDKPEESAFWPSVGIALRSSIEKVKVLGLRSSSSVPDDEDVSKMDSMSCKSKSSRLSETGCKHSSGWDDGWQERLDLPPLTEKKGVRGTEESNPPARSNTETAAESRSDSHPYLV